MSKAFLFQVIQFSQILLIQTIQFSISVVFVNTQLNVKTVLFWTIQFSINTHFSSIWPIDRLYQVLPHRARVDLGAMVNKGRSAFPKAPVLLEASPSDCLVSYPGHSLERFYPSAEMQSVYFTAPADWAKWPVEWTKNSDEYNMETNNQKS